MQEYFSLLTATGANLLINAVANKTPVKLSKIAVSDSEIAPSEAAARLEDTKHEFAINSLTQDPQNPSILNIEGVIPSNVGGFNIRKFAIFTQNGEMFAVGRVPLSYKPALNQGAGSDLVFKIRILIGNVSNIELKVDNSVVLATRDWSEKTFQKLTDAIDAYSKTQSDEKYALKSDVTDGVKIGSYLLWSSQSVTPAGFLVCDGRSLKKREYTELFAVIGYTYGGSGESFNIPKFDDGRFMRSTGGNAAALGVAQGDMFKSHNHSWFFGGQKNSATGAGSTASAGNTRPPNGANEIPTTFEGGVETRPYNMSVVVLIKAKDVKEATASEVDKTPYATEAKAGITKLKNSVTGKAEDVAVTEKAVVDYMEKEISINGNATFDNVKNNIVMSGIGSITLSVGDVIEVKGTSSNDKLFTVESIVSNDEIIVNYEHRGTSTPIPSKRLIKETAQNCVIKLYCRAKDAPLGLGQGWCVPASGRGGNVNYPNNTQRTIAASFYVVSNSLAMVSLGVYLDDIAVGAMITDGRGIASSSATLVPPNSVLKVSVTPNRWTEFR
jgi:putative tail fiber-related protein